MSFMACRMHHSDKGMAAHGMPSSHGSSERIDVSCTAHSTYLNINSINSITSDFMRAPCFWPEPSAVVVPCGGPQVLLTVGHRVDTQHAHHACAARARLPPAARLLAMATRCWRQAASEALGLSDSEATLRPGKQDN